MTPLSAAPYGTLRPSLNCAPRRVARRDFRQAACSTMIDGIRLENEVASRPPGFAQWEEVLGLVEGKTCIVTGGAGSLGLASVRGLLAEGARVMLVDLDADKLARTVGELATDKAAFVAADVTDAAQTRKYVGDTVARWGKIDVLFSNAGNDGPLMPITEYPEDLFDRIMATHVRGCTRSRR